MASDLYTILGRYVRPMVGHLISEHYGEMDLGEGSYVGMTLRVSGHRGYLAIMINWVQKNVR